MENGFTELERGAWGGFLGAYGQINRLIEEDLQSHSRISHVEFEVLLRLHWEPNHRLRIQDLADRSILTLSGVSRMVDRLVKAGLVVREGATEDKRGAYAVITEAGLERLNTAMVAHIVLVRKIFLAHFTEEELQQLTEFWKRLEETNVEK